MVIWLEQGADLHIAQQMPLPITVSCFSKIQIGFSFLVPAHQGSPGQRAVKRMCVCVLCKRQWLAVASDGQVCTLLQTDNHASTPPLSSLQARWLSCYVTNSVKALKANTFPQSLQVKPGSWNIFRKEALEPLSYTEKPLQSLDSLQSLQCCCHVTNGPYHLSHWDVVARLLRVGNFLVTQN